MGVKLSDLPTETSPASSDIMMIADPDTGIAKKITLSALKTFLDSLGGGGSTQLSTPGSFAATPASSTQINLSWTDVANESSYMLEWSPNGSSGWTQIGGTIAAGTTSYNHTGLTASTAYYYRLKAVGNGTTYTDSNYATANGTTSAAGPSLEDLTFPTTAGTLTNTSGVWTSAAGNWNVNKGLSGKKIAAGQNGYIQFQYDASDGENSMLGINTSNSNDDYSSYEMCVWIEYGIGYFIDGFTGGLGSISVGSWLRIKRTGSAVTIEQSTNSGASWSVLRTCTFSSSADLYININFNGNGPGKMYYPKGYNLTNA